MKTLSWSFDFEFTDSRRANSIAARFSAEEDAEAKWIDGELGGAPGFACRGEREDTTAIRFALEPLPRRSVPHPVPLPQGEGTPDPASFLSRASLLLAPGAP